MIEKKNFQISKYLFNAWIRRYNRHSHKTFQRYSTIKNFQQIQNKKKLVDYTKRWIKLYKSKDHYRKMKKIAKNIYSLKVYKHYFLGFSIILEKSKIFKLKLLKALKFYQKNLKQNFFNFLTKIFSFFINKKFQNICALQNWSKKTYKKSVFSWKKFVFYQKNRKNTEKLAWETRTKDLIKKGLILCISYVLSEKSKREEKIRVLILKNNQRSEFLAKKYSKKWLNNTKSKKKPSKDSNFLLQNSLENQEKPQRSQPRRIL